MPRKSRVILEPLETRLALSTASPSAAWATEMRSGPPASIATLHAFPPDAQPDIPASDAPFGSNGYIDLSDKLDLSVQPSGSAPAVVVTDIYLEPTWLATYTMYPMDPQPNIPAPDAPFGSNGYIDLSDKLDLSVQPSGSAPTVVFTTYQGNETTPSAAPAARRQAMRDAAPAREGARFAWQAGARPQGPLAALRAERLAALAARRG